MDGTEAQGESLGSPLLDVDGDGDPSASSCGGREEASSVRAVLRSPWARSALVISFCWDLARASLTFLGPYYVSEEMHDPFVVGLTGAASWIFLLTGPCCGSVSDRWDRKWLMVHYMALMALSTAAVAVAVMSGHSAWWLMVLHMPTLSLCSVLDGTVRMPFCSDLLAASQRGPLIGTMVAIRTVAYNSARVLGSQLAGVVVDYCGFGASFLLVAVEFACGALLLLQLPKFDKAGAEGGGGGASQGWAPFRSRAFVSVFGVTVIANFFYWSYQPLVPVLGAGLAATPSQIGLLSSAPFCGALAVSALLAEWNPRATGALYCVGIALADVVLAGAAAPSLAAAAAGLLCAGGLASLFSTVQAAMVMGMVPADLQGRAMGLLMLAIGAGPFGMATLGGLAASLGAQPALCGFALVGAAAQALWLCFLPDALHVRRTL